jgi:hypothetical protein
LDKTEALRIARDAYSASTIYVDANFRKQWEDALRMFQSKHPLDSKYNQDAYKYRSRLFRPKTRSVIRKNEASAAAAFFSNLDVVNVDPSNEKDPKQVFGAQLYKALLQYRLTKSIPWFMTLIGGFQDAMTVGVVCSYQSWKYREKTESEKEYYLDEETGAAVLGIDGGPMFQESKKVIVLEDRPAVEIRPVENLRIDKGSSWTDPVNSSPYLIDMIPMYLGDLKEMGKPNPKTQEEGWDIPEDALLKSATQQSYDPTRAVREGNREDSKNVDHPINDFSIVWVHKNITRKHGEDFCYFTLGTEHMLSRKVKPLSDFYFHNERPYVMGCAIIETHKIFPSGYPELGREVQKEINDTTNARQDNVKLAMGKRFLVKRGAQVDLKSLVRGVAGSITLLNNPAEDVVPLEFNDVTASAFQEQDRLSVEFDELLGNFSSSSVMTNRKLNETVGGMNLMGQGANQMTEYGIRTFTETWVEPVLRQLVKLEKHYETDEVVLKLMGEKLGAEVTDDSFDTDVELTVNVGMGATDPMMRLNKLLTGARAFAEIGQLQAQGGGNLNTEELGKEVFGAMGYRDGGRFIQEGEDPRMQQMKQEYEEEIAKLQDDLQKAKLNMEAKIMEVELKRDLAIANQEIEEGKAELDAQTEIARLRQELAVAQEKAENEIRIAREKAEADKEIALIKAGAQIDIAQMNGEAKAEATRVTAKAEAEAIGPQTAETLKGVPKMMEALKDLEREHTQMGEDLKKHKEMKDLSASLKDIPKQVKEAVEKAVPKEIKAVLAEQKRPKRKYRIKAADGEEYRIEED